MCDEIVFSNVSFEDCHGIISALLTQDVGITEEEATALKGDLVIRHCKINFTYDAAQQVLTVQCVDKPGYIPCSVVNSKINDAFTKHEAGTGPL